MLRSTREIVTPSMKGYHTLPLDRLGNRELSRPDPSQEAQLSLETEVIHEIIQQVRAGTLCGGKSPP